MKQDNFSREDLKRKIILPNKFDDKLAEEIGIIAGDGHLTTKKKYYGIIVYGHYIDDMDYYVNFVVPLFKNLYNITPNIKRTIYTENGMRLEMWSKAVFMFHNRLGFPRGKKENNIRLPKQILNNTKFLKPFLKGFIDTDGSIIFQKKYRKIYYYPKINIELSDLKLISHIKDMLDKLNFTYSFCKKIKKHKYTKNWHTSYAIDIYGVKNLEKWYKAIGSNNPKHTSKYLIWKKFGQCPPRLTTPERLKLLEKKSL